MNRYCIVDGCHAIVSKGARCPAHLLPRPTNSHSWRQLRNRLVRDHVARYGWSCPGWQRDPHPATDLQGDHRRPLRYGGALLDAGNVAILCKSCNARKRATL